MSSTAIVYTGKGAESFCLSLPGAKVSLPRSFALPAPKLFCAEAISVQPAASPGSWHIVKEMVFRVKVTVTGMFRAASSVLFKSVKRFRRHAVTKLYIKKFALSATAVRRL